MVLSEHFGLAGEDVGGWERGFVGFEGVRDCEGLLYGDGCVVEDPVKWAREDQSCLTWSIIEEIVKFREP